MQKIGGRKKQRNKLTTNLVCFSTETEDKLFYRFGLAAAFFPCRIADNILLHIAHWLITFIFIVRVSLFLSLVHSIQLNAIQLDIGVVIKLLQLLSYC